MHLFPCCAWLAFHLFLLLTSPELVQGWSWAEPLGACQAGGTPQPAAVPRGCLTHRLRRISHMQWGCGTEVPAPLP